MESSKSKGGLEKKEYTEMKDSKRISNSEANFIEMKKKKTVLGKKMISSKAFANEEFANWIIKAINKIARII